MYNMLDHLSPIQRTVLNLSIHKIAFITSAEKIFCYGCRITQFSRWSPFQPIPSGHKRINNYAYDLLLVLPDSNTGNEDSTQELLKNHLDAFSSFSFIIHRRDEVVTRLEREDHFMCTILNKALLLFNNDTPPLATENVCSNADAFKKYAALWWNQWFGLAGQSLLAAYRSAGEYNNRQALNHLYQSTVQTCTALLNAYTGLRPSRRSLNRLLLYCDNFCSLRTMIFPNNTVEEKRLLQSLVKAGEAGNKEKPYAIAKQTVDILLERIGLMHEKAEQLYSSITPAHDTLRQAQGDSAASSLR